MAAASAPKVSTLSLPALLTIICGILACLPFIGEWAVAKTYRTHRRGVVFIAGAGEAPMGHHAVSAMIEDGYLVRRSWGPTNLRRRASMTDRSVTPTSLYVRRSLPA